MIARRRHGFGLRALARAVSNAARQVDVVVIGGGAAGVFCAGRIKEFLPSKDVILLEATSKLLRKVAISGGGRCNVTHDKHKYNVAELCERYPRGQKQLRGKLTRFGLEESHTWFEARGVELKTEADGRVFPATDSSQTIIDCLLEAADGVCIRTKNKVTGVEVTAEGNFRVKVKTLQHDEDIEAQCVVLAPGSSPQLWQVAKDLGLQVVAPVPSLFTLKTNDSRTKGLEGLSVEKVDIWLEDGSAGKLKTAGENRKKRRKRLHTCTGPLLFTHEGISGPAVLTLSSFAALEFNELEYKTHTFIDWTAGEWTAQAIGDALRAQKQSRPKQKVGSVCPLEVGSKPLLPKRLWQRIVIAATSKTNASGTTGEGQCSGCVNKGWATTTKGELDAIAHELTEFKILSTGKTRYKDEFVTAGGIDMHDLDQHMEAKAIPRLFCVGEFLNVDGVTGGFNFTGCWSTGWSAANRISVLLE
jgi:predicted Rossmann fold flavoprotein